MIRDGTTLVEVRALTPDAPDELTRSAQSPPPSLYVQAGAFAHPPHAQHVLERLHAPRLASAFILSPLAGKSPLYPRGPRPPGRGAGICQPAAPPAPTR